MTNTANTTDLRSVTDVEPATRNGQAPGQPEVRRALQAAYRFAQARQRPAAFYVLPDDEPIGTGSVRELGDQIASHLGDRQYDELDLVVDSQGGDIHAAYRLLSYLHLKADRLNACVPQYARSSATLLCIGADTLVLDDLAFLGPLDAQIYNGRNEHGEAKYMSALFPFKSLERLRDFSLDTLRAAAEDLFQRDVTNTDDTWRLALEFVDKTAAPMFSRFESQRLGEYSQALAIGEQYGRRLVERKEGLSEEKMTELLKTIRSLVHEYPSHEFVLDYHELHDRLKLDVERFKGEARDALRNLMACDIERIVMLVDAGTKSEDEWVDEALRSVADPDGPAPRRAPGVGTEEREKASVQIRGQRQVSGRRNPWAKPIVHGVGVTNRW